MSKKWKIAAVCAAVPVLVIIALIIVVHTYDFNRLKPRIESAVQNATGRELTMAGDIELDFGFSPALVVQQVALQNAEWGSEPEMAACERFELEVALLPLITGDIRIKRLILIRPTMLVERSAQENFNYVLDTGPKKGKKKAPEDGEGKPEERALPGLEVNKIRIDGAELMYKDHAADSSFTATLDRMRASAEAVDAPLDFDLKGAFKDIPFSLSGEIGSLQSLMQGEDMPFSLQAGLAGAKADIAGNRTVSGDKNGFSARVDLRADSLKGVNKLAGTDLPRDVPVALRTAVSSPDMQSISVTSLELGLGKSTISGEAELDLGGSVPAAQVSLQSEALDLRPFMPQDDSSEVEEATPEDKDAEDDGRVFPDTPIAADFLHGVKASVRTEVGRLLLPQLQGENLRMDLALANGRLRMDPLRLDTAGGSLEGELGLRDLKRGVAMSTQMKIADMRISKLLAGMGQEEFLQGDLQANLDLAASGGSVADLMGAMSGEAVLIVGEGMLDSAYLEKKAGDVLATLLRYVDPKRKSGEETRINCLVSALDLNKGLAESRVILVDTKRMQILADGNVDLGTEKLDFSFDPSPKEGLDSGALGQASLSLSELSKPFRLSGTLAEPSLALDVQKAALSLGKMLGGTSKGGLSGAAESLLSGSEEESVSCSEAIAVARGEKKAVEKRPAKKESPEESSEDSGEGSTVEKGVQELEEGVKDLF
ncbi:MAG: AsmA family protein [Desulfohalobiaceae bacterium]